MRLLFCIFSLSFGWATSINWNGDWAFSCDFVNHDIGNARVNGENCGSTCEAFQGCTHFSWTTSNGGTCWMKGGTVGKSDAFDTGDQSMVCGVLSSSGGGGGGIVWNGDWAFGCDFRGGDVGNKQVPGEECGSSCAAFQGCTHFTWTNYNGGTCWFKGGTASKSDAFYSGDNGMVCGLLSGSTTATNARGVYVSWPKKVLGLYILLADDGIPAFSTTSNWLPRLYPYQQTGANVLFFSFINPLTMKVPLSFSALAKTRGNGQAGSVPANTVIIFSIGGFGYSQATNPWAWLTSQSSAEAMADQVAKWPELYNCDGIDLDIEEGAGDNSNSGPNLVAFIRRLRQLVPKMIIGQPTYGWPFVPAEMYVINQSWDSSGKSSNLADSVGLMVYEGSTSLNFVKYYVSGPAQGPAMTCRVPTNTIILGASGSASAADIQALTNGVNQNDYRGIMVWCAAVQNGFSYGADDASKYPTSQQAFVNAKNNFAAQN